MIYILGVLGAALLLLLWDAQRRYFDDRKASRAHESDLAKQMHAVLAALEPVITGQTARDERNNRALAAFLTEIKQQVQALHAHAQKSSADTVSKLQQMGRITRR